MHLWQLQQKQGLPLEAKVIMTERRIRQAYEEWAGNAYISFSGGKDSTVLLHIARNIYPDIPAVFVDTGLEYPEVRQFVKTVPNVTRLKPHLSFKEVIERYGWPVVSKEVSEKIYRLRYYNLSEKSRNYILYGDERGTMGKIPEKWKYLLQAPFEINSYCCDVMKKRPLKRFAKETECNPLTGEMAANSKLRHQSYLRNGCNVFNSPSPKSKPLAFWTECDVLSYIKVTNIPYANIYGKIVETAQGGLQTTGVERTGCMFCMFGVHMEHGENRFRQMKKTHPKIWEHCMFGGEWVYVHPNRVKAINVFKNKGRRVGAKKYWQPSKNGLGMGKVLDYLGVDWGAQTELTDFIKSVV